MTKPNTPSRQFETQLDLETPRDAVWRALADGVELARWFAPEASVEPRVGGRVEWRWGEHHNWVSTVEVFEPGERLRLRYDSPVDDQNGGKKPLFVDFVLTGVGGTTTLRLVHSGFGPEADFGKEYDGISRGWPVELQSLKLYLERHRGEDRAVTWFSHPTHLTPEQTWKALTGTGGLTGGAGIDGLAPGAAFALRTPQGDAFTGRVLRTNPREFTGVIENLNDGWLRISVETFTGETTLWFWVATYGEAKAVVGKRVASLRAFLERLYPARVQSESQ